MCGRDADHYVPHLPWSCSSEVMCKKRCSLVKAFDHVLKQRPQIYPNMGFRNQLRQAEIDLFNHPSISEVSQSGRQSLAGQVVIVQAEQAA